jgi:hypothetical protein
MKEESLPLSYRLSLNIKAVLHGKTGFRNVIKEIP